MLFTAPQEERMSLPGGYFSVDKKNTLHMDRSTILLSDWKATYRSVEKSTKQQLSSALAVNAPEDFLLESHLGTLALLLVLLLLENQNL